MNPDNVMVYVIVSLYLVFGAFLSGFTENFCKYASTKMVVGKLVLLVSGTIVWLCKLPFVKLMPNGDPPLWQWYLAMGLYVASIAINFFVKDGKGIR